jgi:hypothetical protein
VIIRRIAVTTASAAAFLLMLAAPGFASTARVYNAGSCSAEGQYATCVASGTAYNPATINVHVSAPRTGLPIFVAWSDVCAKGDGAGTASGHFRTVTDSDRTIRHPYARPDNCAVAADAQLTSDGIHIRVWITYRK